MWPVHIPGLSWWRLWKWPEYLIKWLKGIHEVREAGYKAEKAKIEKQIAENDRGKRIRETTIARYYSMVRSDGERQRETVRGFGIPAKPSCPKREDADLWDEAWQKYWREISEDFRNLYGVSRMPKPPSSEGASRT
jgi:hypothetical protein